MPNVNQMIVSKYLSKEDATPPLILTIRGVTLESFGGRDAGEQAWVLYFQEHRKGLKLNNTNLKLLGAGLGQNSDAWVGKRVRLWVDPSVTMAGQLVGGLRIQLPRGAGAPTPGAPVTPRFDPLTGAPLGLPPAPATPRFDPMTGEPLSAGLPAPAPSEFVDEGTGEVLPVDPEFDDDIPF